MWLGSFHATSITVLFVLASATGSCLEYGHSCWGAHGKRSGGGGLLRGTANLPNAELTVLPSRNKNHAASSHDKIHAARLYNQFEEEEEEEGGNGRSFPSKQYQRKNSKTMLHKRHSGVDQSVLATDNIDLALFNRKQPVTEEWRKLLPENRNKIQGLQEPTAGRTAHQQRQQLERQNRDENYDYFDYK